MKLSVIIPCFSEPNVQEIVDLSKIHESKKHTVEYLICYAGKQPPVHHVVTLKCDEGRSIQLNKGITRATGDVLLFLHADTQLPKDWDEMIASKILNGKVCGGFYKQFDSPHWLLALNSFGTNVLTNFGFFLGDNAMWITKKDMMRIGGFDSVPIFEDIFMSREFRKRPHVTIRTPVITSARTFMTNGVFRTLYKMQIVRLKYVLGEDLNDILEWYKS